MFRVLSILGGALGNLIRPRSPLARAITPILLIKITILVLARTFWFGPLTHHVAAPEVATQLIAAPSDGETRGDLK